ncbi:unnamed protein product [Menidia menidia]|uniref:(Atlantic silverside) hypothetical protein n=1 Tax=Menidia menidia TaxID=238744 RepID=A0A8S4AG08_9TELE|nr:unnamed protein product [Menidia menidia]
MADTATRRTEGSQLSCWKTVPTTTLRTPPLSTTPCEDCRKAERYITHLKADIRRHSDDLRKKESLLTDFIDTAATQSKIISTMDSAMADTILWDPPSLCHRPSSCSTPSSQASWTAGKRKGTLLTSKQTSDVSRTICGKKESLLTDFIDNAATQSKIISTMDSAMADTILWDPPSLCHRPSSCSTPSSQASWSVVVGKGKSGSPCATSPPSLQITNRFATLPPDVPAHPADVPMADAVSVVGAPTTTPTTGLDVATAAPPPADAPAPPAAAVTMVLPPAAAVWSRTGARPKASGPNSPANRPSHLTYGTDVVRGEHPASPTACGGCEQEVWWSPPSSATRVGLQPRFRSPCGRS